MSSPIANNPITVLPVAANQLPVAANQPRRNFFGRIVRELERYTWDPRLQDNGRIECVKCVIRIVFIGFVALTTLASLCSNDPGRLETICTEGNSTAPSMAAGEYTGGAVLCFFVILVALYGSIRRVPDDREIP